MKSIGVRGRFTSVDSLRLRLLAAVGGVTVSVACAGRSLEHGSNDDGGSSGSSSGASGGAGGSVAGSGSVGGTGSVGGSGALGGTAGTDGGKGGSGGDAGGTLGGSGGTAGDAGGPSGAGGSTGGSAGKTTLGCTAAGQSSFGLEYCEGGYVHRDVAGVCPSSPRRGPSEGGAAGAAGAASEGAAPPPPDTACESDYDCNESPFGHCMLTAPVPTGVPGQPVPSPVPYCHYGCTTDGDCSAGNICLCRSDYISAFDGASVATGTCMSADCSSDADCSDGALCVAAMDYTCGSSRIQGFRCQSPLDACSGPGDCPSPANTCSFKFDHNVCTQTVCGRPFLVGGTLRQSELARSSDWLDVPIENTPFEALDTPTRAAIAEHWAKAGLMEHASIAAFARFVLQLLALGAPPDLVARATDAIADETRHARLCFRLASRYAGCGVGPSALDVNGTLDGVNLLAVAALVLDEGCIGETAAALEATWAADAATDPSARAVLAGIAEDEARHAELAYAFVAWAARQDTRVLPLARSKLAAALATAGSETPVHSLEQARASRLAAHGVLPASERQAAKHAALREILPALLARLDPIAPNVSSASAAA